MKRIEKGIRMVESKFLYVFVGTQLWSECGALWFWFLRAGGSQVDFTHLSEGSSLLCRWFVIKLCGSSLATCYHQSSFKSRILKIFKSKTVLLIIVWCSFS